MEYNKEHLEAIRKKVREKMQKPIHNRHEKPKKKKEPLITKHKDKHHHIAQSLSEKADPHWEMADRPHLTRGHKVYEDYMKNHK